MELKLVVLAGAKQGLEEFMEVKYVLIGGMDK